MSDFSWEAFSRYTPVAIGVGIGTAARYGLVLSEGQKLTWRGFVADLLMMGMVALLALVAVEQLRLERHLAILTAALFALASQRAIWLARERFVRRLEAGSDGGQDGGLASASRAADVALVPPGRAPATAVTVFRADPSDPRATPIAALGERALPTSRDELDALLKRAGSAIDGTDKQFIQSGEPSMWTWSQSAGELSRAGQFVARGYAGRGEGKNNPARQDEVGTGPIPRGGWRLTGVKDSPNTGPFSIVLEPEAGTDTRGRSAFRIHGDSKRAPGTASRGCIILPRAVRELVWNSGDHILEVVE